nr:MAG TPA: hypothetical protein [Caudoviricetes sp.]
MSRVCAPLIHTFRISFCAVNTGLVNNFQFFKVAKTLGF